MNNIEILEELADNEHSRWANWQKYVHSKCIKNKDGSLTIPKEYVDHWNYEINTEYKDLPENIKESDRKEARKILETLNYKNLIQENKKLKKQMGKDLDVVYIKGVYDERDKWKNKVKEKIKELDKKMAEDEVDEFGIHSQGWAALDWTRDFLLELLEGE